MKDAADIQHVKPFFFRGLGVILRGQRMWTPRNWESLDSTVFLFHKGPTPGDFPRLECNMLLPLCSLLSFLSSVLAHSSNMFIMNPLLLSLYSPTALPLLLSHPALWFLLCYNNIKNGTKNELCSRHAWGDVRDLLWEEKKAPRRSRPHWGASALGRCTAHVQSWGRYWGMCTLGHLLQICSRLNGHQGGLASSLRKHAEQCVFSAPILNSRSQGSVLPCAMKMTMALKGSVLLMMNIQYVLSLECIGSFRL